MNELLWSGEVILFVLAFVLFILGGGMLSSGPVGLLEELLVPVYFLGGFFFAMTGVSHAEFILPIHIRIPTLVGANVLFLIVFLVQLRAKVKRSDDGPTHPKNEPYQGGGQTHIWDDDE